MTYPEVIERLGIERVCLGGCGLNEYRHRGSIFMGVIHWQDRRLTRRGLYRFLLLAARRSREEDPGYLNDWKFIWLYHWLDHRAVDDYGTRLGIRFPVAFSKRERQMTYWIARIRGLGLSNTHPAVYSWAKRGFDAG